MMRNLFSKVVLLSLMILVIGACKKNGVVNNPPQSVVWAIDAGPNQAADTISFLRLFGYNYIYGTKGTTKIYIATTSTALGSYTSLSTTAAVGLTIAGTQYGLISATITINSNTDSRLRGTFSGMLTNAGAPPVNLSGSFTDVQFY